MDRSSDDASASRLGLRTWPETERLGSPLLVIPLGATEQHGHHLPLDTDTIIATAWADHVAAGITGAVAAPPLPYGSSGEHQAFPGTLSIGRAALHTVIIELARSAAADVERIVFLSGHAGNDATLEAAVAQLRHEGHDVTHLVPWWPTDRFDGIDAHAGRTETSLMLHLAPDRVRIDRAEAGHVGPLTEVLDQLMAEGVAAVAANGVLGDPTGASADEGQALFDDLVRRTIQLLSTNPGASLGPFPGR